MRTVAAARTRTPVVLASTVSQAAPMSSKGPVITAITLDADRAALIVTVST